MPRVKANVIPHRTVFQIYVPKEQYPYDAKNSSNGKGKNKSI